MDCYHNSNQNNKIYKKFDDDLELEDLVMTSSDLSSDEDFDTLYSCSICNASAMPIGEFFKHTKTHSTKDKNVAFEKVTNSKRSEDLAVKNYAAAHGFKKQELKSSVPLYFCSICGQGNLTLNNLKEHNSLHPEFIESHLCIVCQQQFCDRNVLSEHLNTHLENNDLICQYCNRRYIIIDDLEKHEAAHSLPEYICVECRQQFKTKKMLINHLLETHSSVTSCKICKKDFHSYELLHVHMASHIAINVIKNMVKCYACEFCAKRYENRISLQRHVLFLHNERLPLECEQCEFIAHHQESINEHLAKDHPETPQTNSRKRYCDSNFKNKSDIGDESSNHSGSNNSDCQSWFDNGLSVSHSELNDNVQVHCYKSRKYDENFVKGKTKIKIRNLSFDMICDICGKVFDRESLLKIHMSNFHTGVFNRFGTNCEELPFKCEKCIAYFKVEFEFEKHMETHKEYQEI